MNYALKAALGLSGMAGAAVLFATFFLPEQHVEPLSLEKVLAAKPVASVSLLAPHLDPAPAEMLPPGESLPARGGGRPVLAFTFREGIDPPSPSSRGRASFSPSAPPASSRYTAGYLPPREEVIYKKLGEDGTLYLTNRPDGDTEYTVFVRYRVADLIASLGMDALMDLAVRYGTLHGVDPHLIRAIIRAESGGNELAVSHAGAEGLMQLMPDTGRALGVRDAFDPEDNVYGGTLYIRQMLDKYGDLSLALAAYNAGPGNVDKYGGIPPFQETQEYVKRVMRFYEENKSK